ncbi:ribosome silencing factor [Alphaproteobacteria bacterium KMM 3653]|uniref:Ribosomal silencing factor RsfS n=1 Tax=Harenicola maris TaxID=2841044 RepID=A0AAP2CTP3_9RHOB|nr:ribosome silencing factor [Harenicola maris]
MTLSNTTQTTEEPVAKKATAKSPKDRRASEALLQHILASLEADKAEDIVQIDLKGKSEMADYMVICSGRSSRQVSALSEKLNDSIKADLGRACKIEGKGAGDWVLIDTGDVIVHIFRPEVREFYQLEKMWQPGTSAPAAPEGTPSDYTPDA